MTSTPKFQFHKGTIRTQFGSESVVNLNLFQFHKGTIRTFRSLNSTISMNHFNSIKVQLEPCGAVPLGVLMPISIP